jgi:hypothetical protein
VLQQDKLRQAADQIFNRYLHLLVLVANLTYKQLSHGDNLFKGRRKNHGIWKSSKAKEPTWQRLKASQSGFSR